ncbi:hypothetical protein FDP41_003998 [Naegleria fowleri]|uniref:Uncharacterized protein n=1 Tax=Naegleria fowleri TaxID=5763 RepID=A0A6A5BFT9_NAEFO|nr:uncharacterized protein FDP41_003998 [Naegleria fowleri]KAF0976703.1 hypothetical protein FDP41_003998 [Naegleria fowleri]CAG4714429.1 unnamed protein product [Naegleria fowleri]
MLSDVHAIFGYLISRYMYHRNFVSDHGKRNLMIPESDLVKHSEHFKHISEQYFMIGKTLLDGSSSYMSGASKLLGKDKIHLLRKTSFRQFFKILSTNMFKFIRRIRRFFSNLTFEQKYYVIGMVLANLPDIDIITFIISFGFSFFKGFSKMIDRFHRLWELFISLTNKKQDNEATSSSMSNTSGLTSSLSSSSLAGVSSGGNLSQYDSDSEDVTMGSSIRSARNLKLLERRNKNSLTWRRLTSHSIIVNLIMSPLIGYATQKVLGLHGFNSFTHCTSLAVMCLSSHLLLDFLTNFGTALFYPLSNELYSFGIVTSWDFTLIVFFYGWLTVSRWNKWKPAKVFWIGLICFFCIAIWKRAMMCEVYSRYFFFMESQKRKSSKSIQNAPTIWLQPSNFFSGQYTVMKYEPKQGDLVTELKTVQATKYISLINWILTAFGFRVSDVRQIQISHQLGVFRGQVAPRQFLMVLYSNLKNRKVLYEMIKSSLPSALFMFLYMVYLVRSDE